MLLKRCFDLCLTLPIIIILLPFYILIAIIIKMDSPGPVFFLQTRVGRFGRLFQIIKFRTMITNAESLGMQITVKNDSRITGSGRFLRKFKLDELPQLFNVLKGEMSLVGPRPEVPKYVEKYPEREKKIVLSVPPGITDLASIHFKDENELLDSSLEPDKTYVEEILPVKLSYYVRYVSERNIWLDFKIIFQTVLAVLKIKVPES